MLGFVVHVILKKALVTFWTRHDQAEAPLRAWYSLAKQAAWRTPQDVKADFGNSVDFVGGNRAIFDVGGNKYRVICVIAYGYGRVLVRFVGTHAEHDRVDAAEV